MFDSMPLSLKVRVLYCIFPFCMNLCFLLFVCFSITRTLIPQEPRNSIAVTTIFLLWLVQIATMVLYGRIMTSASELFYGRDNFALSIWLSISYPVFFFFFLPFAIYRIIVFIGTPNKLWERAFGQAIAAAAEENASCLRYVYVGIPWFIFAAVYILLMVALAPLWYFVLSPLGMGMYSICLAVGLNSDEFRASSINDRVERTYRWGMVINLFVLALLGIAVGSAYVALVASHWWALLLLIVCSLYFLVGIVPTVRDVCLGNFSIVADLQP
jgi:hypothetical protein